MKKNKKFLSVILARGGSKRLHAKNVLDLCGKPLVSWSIETALKSKYIDTILVSSNDDHVLDIAKEYGVQTLKRPDNLSSDTASTHDALVHALNNTEKHEYVMLLQPTSPLRNEIHVDKAVEFLKEKNADAVISVCEVDDNPLWTNTLNDDLSMNSFMKEEVKNKRSQDLDKYYKLNGAIHICKTDKFLKEKGFFIKNNIFAFKMDRKSSIDIDEAFDYELAKVFMKDYKDAITSLRDKVVIITGGAGLIGKEFVKSIIKQGSIAIIADINENLGKKVKDNLSAELNTKNIDHFKLDITCKDSLDECIQYLHKKYKRIDALVNNAYPKNKNFGNHFLDVAHSDFVENVGLHLGGYFTASQQFAKYFQQQGYGNIINISSIYGMVAPEFDIYKDTEMTMPIEYAAIKSGLNNLTRYMAKYFENQNIRINTISPGGILDNQPQEFLKEYNKKCSSKGMLNADDLNGTLIFLLSDMSRYLNGQNILVDDGFTL
jgi:CMP-N-acetylneuraminic acid synthetase/NAD(P)-dependent dehydrogenase (short-subunit alcohol dehydrogenase family)